VDVCARLLGHSFGFADACGRLHGRCVGCADVCCRLLGHSLFLRMSVAVPVVVPLVAGMSAAVCMVAKNKQLPLRTTFFVYFISTEPVLRANKRFFNQTDLLIRVLGY
jgi:hypothetical protein